jgi:hypothetical protein
MKDRSRHLVRAFSGGKDLICQTDSENHPASISGSGLCKRYYLGLAGEIGARASHESSTVSIINSFIGPYRHFIDAPGIFFWFVFAVAAARYLLVDPLEPAEDEKKAEKYAKTQTVPWLNSNQSKRNFSLITSRYESSAVKCEAEVTSGSNFMPAVNLTEPDGQQSYPL